MREVRPLLTRIKELEGQSHCQGRRARGRIMSDNYDGYVNCPHCGERLKGPKPATKTKDYLRMCDKCKCAYVVQDRVTHRYQTAPPAPMQVGDRFRRAADTLFHYPNQTYDAHSVHLTETQGWWVSGYVDGEHACHMPCENAVIVDKKLSTSTKSGE